MLKMSLNKIKIMEINLVLFFDKIFEFYFYLKF